MGWCLTTKVTMTLANYFQGPSVTQQLEISADIKNAGDIAPTTVSQYTTKRKRYLLPQRASWFLYQLPIGQHETTGK